MRNENFSHLECPLARTLSIVGEWWTLLIIRDLFYKINTFDTICEDLAISRNILTDRLKKLEKNGIIEKQLYVERPKRYKYQLTKKGKDLYPVILTMVAWAEQWESPKGKVVLLKHDGHLIETTTICRKCGKAIEPRDVQVEIGPGASRPDVLPLPLRPNAGRK
jgi:DNA-binding HxlR family transcriptional regulator